MSGSSQPVSPPAPGEASSLICRLLPYIAERRLAPGDRLPSERLLAKRFDVTRAVVREALAVLEAMRVVECRPRSGNYLREESRVGSLDAAVMKVGLGLPFDRTEADHLNEFRSIIESHAIVLACARRTDEDIERLDRCMAETRGRFAAGESIAQPSAEFHLALVAATHNQFLLRAAHSCYLAASKPREQLFADPVVARRSIRDHQAIRDAIVEGSAARAQRILKSHLKIADRYWHAYASEASKAREPKTRTNRRRRGTATP